MDIVVVSTIITIEVVSTITIEEASREIEEVTGVVKEDSGGEEEVIEEVEEASGEETEDDHIHFIIFYHIYCVMFVSVNIIILII